MCRHGSRRPAGFRDARSSRSSRRPMRRRACEQPAREVLGRRRPVHAQWCLIDVLVPAGQDEARVVGVVVEVVVREEEQRDLRRAAARARELVRRRRAAVDQEAAARHIEQIGRSEPARRRSRNSRPEQRHPHGRGSQSLPASARSRRTGTRHIASATIEPVIFDAPARRSTNVIGTSSTRRPARFTR